MSAGLNQEHDESDHGVEIRTNPVTPVKVEESSASPSHTSARDE
jgi:hypothetical protein